MVKTIQSNLFNTDRGVRIIEVENVLFLAFLGPNELSVIERCLYYESVHKDQRLDCSLKAAFYTDQSSFTSMHTYMYYINQGGI